MAKASLKNDKQRGDEAHDRWLTHRNRLQGDPDYRDEWWVEQCGRCAHWVPLSGVLGFDWGVCGNSESPFDGLARFEHDGCEAWEEADVEWVQPDQ